MIKGCQRRIYYVKNPESEVFDEAYFILRRGAGTAPGKNPQNGSAVLKSEAERIVRDAGNAAVRRRRNRKEKIYAFVLGAASAALALSLYFFVFGSPA